MLICNDYSEQIHRRGICLLTINYLLFLMMNTATATTKTIKTAIPTSTPEMEPGIPPSSLFHSEISEIKTTLELSSCYNHDKIEWLSRDNLSSPPFALVTYIKSFYKIRSEIRGTITGS